MDKVQSIFDVMTQYATYNNHLIYLVGLDGNGLPAPLVVESVSHELGHLFNLEVSNIPLDEIEPHMGSVYECPGLAGTRRKNELQALLNDVWVRELLGQTPHHVADNIQNDATDAGIDFDSVRKNAFKVAEIIDRKRRFWPKEWFETVSYYKRLKRKPINELISVERCAA